MDNLKKFQNQMEIKLQNATDLERIHFALDICKRLLPDYIDFESKNNWGNSNTLSQSIKYLDSNVYENKTDLNEIDSLIKKVDSVVPDTEDFSDWDVSFALNSSLSIFELLTYIKDRDYKHIMNISVLMTDNIDFKIQMNNNNILDYKIDNHAMLIDEFKYQLELIK
jgi:uncharacterized protein YjaG (DUF416 family)